MKTTPREMVAGIVLAAGGSKRFGDAKITLDWQGKPFLRHVSLTALQAGLCPLYIISGAYPQEVNQAVRDLPVDIIENPHWRKGLSSSLKLGVQCLLEDDLVSAVIIMLADQPQIPPELLKAMLKKYQQTQAQIIAPFIGEQRANPVLFNRTVFADLLTVQGDQGGRELIQRYDLVRLNWQDPSILCDVDTPSDYTALMKMHNFHSI